MCHLWELLCCCGGRIPPLLSSAPNESVLICAICGRLSSAAGSVNSVQSVGGLLFAECILPQISQIYTEVRLSSRGCTCLKCTNRAMLIYLLLRWRTSCSGKRQSQAETSALPEVGRFCEFCAICGSHFAVEGVSKLASVTPRRGRST